MKTTTEEGGLKITKSTTFGNTITSSHSSSAMPLPPITKKKKKLNGKRKKKKSEKLESGFIFMCNQITKPECYRYRVFGLHREKFDDVKEIKPGTKLFLYDINLKLLYGVYKATSVGTLDLEPAAFRGKFPSQVRFKISKECLPLPEIVFKAVIRDNYQGSKFTQQLTRTQVKELISLFRPLASTAPTTDLSNFRIPRSFPYQVLEDRFQPPARLCHIPVLQLPDTQSKQIVVPVPYGQYGPVAGTLPRIEHRHVVQQAAFAHKVDSSTIIHPTREHRSAIQEAVVSYKFAQHDQYGPMATIQPPMEHRNIFQHDQHGMVVSIHPQIKQRHAILQASLPHNVGSPASIHTTIEHQNLVQQAFPHNMIQRDQHGPTDMMQTPLEHRKVIQHDQHGQLTSIHPPIEQRQATLPHNVDSHYVADAHNSYLYENPSPSLRDPYRRYRMKLEKAQKDPIVQNGSQHKIPSPGYALENYAQHFPATVSHVTLQSQPLPPSHMPPLSAGLRGELPVPHEPYHPVLVHENLSQVHANPLHRPLPGSSESNVPVSSHYSFSRAAPTYP